jgi:MFS family permease
LLLAGVLGPAAGRLIDRRGGRDVLASTNLVFAAGLVILALSSGTLGLVLAWTIIGIGMGFGLYETAFATVAGLYGRDARNAITGITLFAGFASTLGWPASAIFISALGGRGACLAWAALHLLIGLPMNALLVPKNAPVAPEVTTHPRSDIGCALDHDRPRKCVWCHLVRLDRHGSPSATVAASYGAGHASAVAAASP